MRGRCQNLHLSLPLRAIADPRRWEKFSAAASSADNRGKPGVVAGLFPFSEYFADAPQPLFKPGASYEDDMEVGGGAAGGAASEGCW